MASEPKVQTLSLHAMIGILIGMLACFPFIVDWATSKTYATHRRGVIFINGAASGALGHAAVSSIIEDGYLVYAGVKNDAEAAALPESSRPNMLKTITLDASSDESIDAAVAHFASEIEGKDFAALVNLSPEAGTTAPMEVHDITTLQESFNAHVFETVRVTQKFLPLVRQHGSRIVMMSNLCAHLTPPLFGGFCSCKAALEAVADSLRRELAPYSVSVSSIEPVTTPTLPSAESSSIASEVYSHLYAADKVQGLDRFVAKDQKESEATHAAMYALVHSISSTHPKIRYVTGNIGYLPEAVVALLSWALPSRVVDALLE